MKYIIMTDVEKAVGDAPPEKGHKAYSRKSPKGKLENIKQAGIVRGPQDKPKEPSAGGEQPVTSDAKVGSTITVEGGGQAKVTAVGKDGVTAEDDKGKKYQVVHNAVKVSGESEKQGEGEDHPFVSELKKLAESGSDEQKKYAQEHLKDAQKITSGKPIDHSFAKLTPKSETDAGVVDEFKKLVDFKVDKSWVVPDPKHEGVFLMFTTGPKGEKNAAIYYRGSEEKPGDVEEVDFDEAMSKYGPAVAKKELEENTETKSSKKIENERKNDKSAKKKEKKLLEETKQKTNPANVVKKEKNA